MNRTCQVFIGILMGALLVMFLANRCQRRKIENDLAWHREALDSCLNAPERIDTVYLEKNITDTVRLSFTERVIDTVTRIRQVKKKEYSGVYINDMLRVRWSAIVMGELLDVRILPSSSYRYPQVQTTRTVVLPAREPPATGLSTARRSSLFLYAGAGFYSYNPKVMDVGVLVVFKNGLGMGIGGQLNGPEQAIGLHAKVLYRLF